MKRFDFLKFFPTRFYNDQDAAGGGAPSPAPDAGGDLGVADILGDDFPAEMVASDPELQEIIESEKKVAKKEDSTGDAGDDIVDNPTDDEVKDSDANAGEDDDLSDVEFDDDVIKGLKADHLKGLPKEALVALADFHGEHETVKTERDKMKGELDKVNSDPIVKRRMELLKQGKQEFEVRGITAEEKSTIIGQIEKIGDLTTQEATAVYGVLEKGFDDAVKQAAADAFQNLLLEETKERQVQDILREGRQVLLSLGKFHPDLQFKETDASKFWDQDGNLDSKHPEAKRFAEKVYPVLKELSESGVTYNSLVQLNKKFGPESVYTLFAKKLGLPVMVNADETVSKIAASELRKKLNPFIKKSSVRELDTKTSSPTPGSKGRADAVVKHGYDVERLHTDERYYESMVQATHGAPEKIALIESLEQEGEAIHSRKQRLKK